MTKKIMSTEMTCEQVANYARKLMNSNDAIEKSLGETMIDAAYEAGPHIRVAHTIGRLNGRAYTDASLSKIVATIIARIKSGSSDRYILYVNNVAVHTCNEWYEAHNVYHLSYGIDEWNGLAIYCSLDGRPIWGNTPEKMLDVKEARRLKTMRTKYVRKDAERSEEERERVAREKLAAIVEKTRVAIAEIDKEVKDAKK